MKLITTKNYNTLATFLRRNVDEILDLQTCVWNDDTIIGIRWYNNGRGD